ncbi:MAG: ABC transporter ATP-binding protein [bacterium]|nr:ABC transporter ATP-binding protein [bacterium]
MFAIEVHELTKRFHQFIAVNQVTFAVREKEIFGFLGANGAGKTTVIRMLCGLLTPTSGTAKVSGYDIQHEVFQVKKNIGYMSQKFSLYEDLSPLQNINLYAGLYRLSNSIRKERIDFISHRLQLINTNSKRVKDLPVGYKQRLALGCAILHQPKILFLDEPTSGVDPSARQMFWDIIYEEANYGTTILVTTHYMEEAEYCSQVSIMDQGKIIAQGTPKEVKQLVHAKTMQDAFLKIVEKARS